MKNKEELMKNQIIKEKHFKSNFNKILMPRLISQMLIIISN